MTQFILEQGPQETDPGSIYGRTDIFEIPQRGYIKMMFLKITARFEGVTLISNKSILTAFEIHKAITLESEGTAFCFDNHVYGQCRTFQLHADAYDQVKNASTQIATITAAAPMVKVRPLYFTAFDNGNRILATEGLTVRAITMPDFASMGFNRSPVSIDVRLKVVYEQATDYVQRPLAHTYNSRAYQGIPLATGSTSYRLKLNCPYDVISLMFMIRAGRSEVSINSVHLSFPNGEYGLYENGTDFSLTSTGSMEHDLTMFIVSFGSRTDTDHIKLNKSMNPTVALLNFAASPAGAILYHVIEYHSTLEYSNGRFVELIKDSTR